MCKCLSEQLSGEQLFVHQFYNALQKELLRLQPAFVAVASNWCVNTNRLPKIVNFAEKWSEGLELCYYYRVPILAWKYLFQRSARPESDYAMFVSKSLEYRTVLWAAKYNILPERIKRLLTLIKCETGPRLYYYAPRHFIS